MFVFFSRITCRWIAGCIQWWVNVATELKQSLCMFPVKCAGAGCRVKVLKDAILNLAAPHQPVPLFFLVSLTF